MYRWFIILLALASPISHALTLDTLQQRFSQQPVVRAQFKQIRQIQGMRTPLVSSGQFLMSQNQGLWWNQEQPFKLTVLLTQTKMVQTMIGQAPQIMTAKTHPALFQFNTLLFGLLKADKKMLTQNFSIQLEPGEAGRWKLDLRPKSAPLDKLFNRITLYGDQYIQRINMIDRLGDTTDITFSKQRTEPTTLSHEEALYFAS